MSQLWKGCVKTHWRKCYGCDLQCFITIINTGLNDVKCSKASNTLCIIHDPCVVILLLFQSTFPPVIMFPLLGKLLLPQRWSRKTSFFGGSRETDECKRLSTRPRRLLMFKALHLSDFPHIPHPSFCYSKWKLQRLRNNRHVLRILLVFHFVFEVQAATCAWGHRYPNRCWISKDFEQMAC